MAYSGGRCPPVTSKRLTDAEVNPPPARLRLAVHQQGGNRIELVAHVEAHGADRRLIAKPGTHRVAQVVQLEAQRVRPHVAAVEKQDASEVATNDRAHLFTE